jgi:hypothetical protein
LDSCSGNKKQNHGYSCTYFCIFLLPDLVEGCDAGRRVGRQRQNLIVIPDVWAGVLADNDKISYKGRLQHCGVVISL